MMYYVIGLAVILAALVILCLSVYVKAPPSYAYVLSGVRKQPRVLIGTGGLKIPFFERLDKVFLGQITVDIKTDEPVPTSDFINVDVDAVAKVAVGKNIEDIRLAAKNFLNMGMSQISTELKDNLQGNLREIIGSLDLRSLNTNRDGFSDEVMNKATPDMRKLGIEILSCNIQNITDKQGLIANLGADNTYAIRKNASITKANAERDIAVAEQEAKKIANDVRVKTETEIAERNNELAIKKADLKKLSDTKQADADAAYEIQKQEQLKTINAKTVDAQIEQTKREQQLAEEQVKVTQNKLKAEVNAKADAAKYQQSVIADANKYKTQIDAEAALEQQKREAEAAAYLAQKEADAIRAKAEAKKYEMMQEAEGIQAKGLAEAEAIKAKGIAEATAIEKRYEAWNKFGGDLAKIEMLSKYLPEVAKSVAEPISAIDNLNIYGGDGSSSASKLSANVPVVVKQTLDTIESVTGVDLAKFAKSKIYSISEHDNKTIEDVDFDDAE